MNIELPVRGSQEDGNYHVMKDNRPSPHAGKNSFIDGIARKSHRLSSIALGCLAWLDSNCSSPDDKAMDSDGEDVVVSQPEVQTWSS